ncbi:MAG TPA: DnaJ domain-containing protein [Pyrinomonadaceae bacterium]|jgi:predicted phage tail protein|nr:DnaJ domain-containing protein [Pyrinomonadaceae bacterium]
MSEADERRDYYMVLGAERDDTREEIERRYKRLAVEHHPDRGGDEEEMKAINEAWGVLKDEETRDAYDAKRDAYDAKRDAYAARREAYVTRRGRAHVAPDFTPSTSAGAQADAIGGRLAGALLILFAGVVLIFLVRFHYVVFLWPLALLGLSFLLFGVWMAHAALAYARESYEPTHLARRLAWAQEMLFWSAVAGGGYGLYALLTAI